MVKEKTIYRVSYWDGIDYRNEIFKKEPVAGYLNAILQNYNNVIINKETYTEPNKEINKNEI